MKTILYDNYDCRFDEAEQELLAMYGGQPTDDQVCDYFHIEIDQYGRLNVNCTHHDGTNKVTVKALTDKGTDLWNTYLNNWCYYYHHENPKRYKNEYDEYTYEQMHEVLFNSKTYSKNYGRVA